MSVDPQDPGGQTGPGQEQERPPIRNPIPDETERPEIQEPHSDPDTTTPDDEQEPEDVQTG